MCDYFLWDQYELLLEGPCVLPLETPTSHVIKMVSPGGVPPSCTAMVRSNPGRSTFFTASAPGSSYPSIQRSMEPLTGDLPITVPSPVTFEFWKLLLTLSILHMANIANKMLSISPTLIKLLRYSKLIKLYLNFKPEKFARTIGGWRAKTQVILKLTGQQAGHHMLWLHPSSQPMRIFNLTGVLFFQFLCVFCGQRSFYVCFDFFRRTTLYALKHPLNIRSSLRLKDRHQSAKHYINIPANQ